FVLTVNIEQKRRKFSKSCDGARLIVNEDAISAVRRDFPAHDHLILVGIQSQAVQLISNVDFENRFDDRAGFPAANHSGRRLGAREKPKRVHNQGFAGAGLTGKKTETAFKMKFELIDESKISDTKKTQHSNRGYKPSRVDLSTTKRLTFHNVD